MAKYGFWSILALAIVLSLASCEVEHMDIEINPFVGTWKNVNGISGIVIFTYDEVRAYGIEGDLFWSGDYAFDDEYITVSVTFHALGFVFDDPFWYRLEGDTLEAFGGTWIRIESP